MGATKEGKKELVAIGEGLRESEDAWREVLLDLKKRGLAVGPELAAGDGALGFWAAISKEYPNAAHQRCWVHKTANVVAKLPKSSHGKAKGYLKDIYTAETRKQAEAAMDHFCEVFEPKHPNAVKCLIKDKMELLAFYDFPRRTLDSSQNDQPHRVTVCYYPAKDKTNKRPWFSKSRIVYGIQACSMRREEVE